MNAGARLATPGAVLMLIGVVLMWWGAGVFRGSSPPMTTGITSRVLSTLTPERRGSGGGSALHQ